MPIEWVRVRHEEHGGETEVPTTALAGARRRGFHPVDEEAAATTTEVVEQPEPKSRQAKPAATADSGSAVTTTSTKES